MRIPNKGDYRYFDEVSKDQELVRLRRENEAFRSGRKYQDLREQIERERRQHERQVKKLKREHTKEMREADREIRELRGILSDLTEDTLHEIAEVKQAAYREISELVAVIEKLKARIERYRERCAKHAQEKYAAQTEMEKARGEAARLTRMLNADETNSGLPSSARRYIPYKQKKIVNNREKTGRSPGAQPGHEHHGRHWHDHPDEVIVLQAEEYDNNPLYRRTGKYVAKQTVALRLVPYVVEYRAPVYRTKAGGRVHPAFPEELHDEVQYDATVEAFCLALTFGCNTSAERASALIRDASHGRINVSHGFITGLLKKFSEKTAPDRKVIWDALVHTRHAHIDTSFVTQSGRYYPVTVFADQNNVWYSATEHKGHEAAQSTPATASRAVLTHDEEPTFQNYGIAHQDCLVHKCRRLKDAIDNEPEHTWHTDMRAFLQGLLHARKSWGEDGPSCAEVERAKKEYDEIVAKGEREYEYIPPNPYYTKGSVLLQKMKANKADILYFLDHPDIVPHNNYAERLLRKCKMKDRQAVTFRSPEYVGYFAHFLTYTQTRLLQGRSLYDTLCEVFARPSVRPRSAPPASRRTAS